MATTRSCKPKKATDGGQSRSYQQPVEGLRSRLYSQSVSKIYSDKRLGPFTGPGINRYSNWKHIGILDLWSVVVEVFTARQLSVASDRPLAISGLANKYGELVDGKYIAGIRGVNLIDGFLWRRSSSFKASHRLNPSWSWTSIDSKIYYNLFQDLSRVNFPSWGHNVQLASLLAAFGAVEFASLTVQGRM